MPISSLPSQKISHPSWVEIDLKQLSKNIRLIQEYSQGCLYCLPVKANAYGHGLIEVGKLANSLGVDYLGIAHFSEGLALRKAGVTSKIILFGPTYPDQIQGLIEADIEFSISSMFKARFVAEICQELNKRCKVHLEVDTGMNRTGVRPSTAIAVLDELEHSPYFEVVGIYSHLASSETSKDPFTLDQIKQFEQFKTLFSDRKYLWHLANSGGVAHYPQAFFDMVRPGLISYGYLPSEDIPKGLEDLKPCFSLKSQISFFKVALSGQGISYNHTYKVLKNTRIVTVPIGYGDGYLRALSNKSSVIIRGKKYPIRGSICMDQLMVEIGEDEAYVGDEVILIGQQDEEKIDANDLSKLINSNPREILSLINDRTPKMYLWE